MGFRLLIRGFVLVLVAYYSYGSLTEQNIIAEYRVRINTATLLNNMSEVIRLINERNSKINPYLEPLAVPVHPTEVRLQSLMSQPNVRSDHCISTIGYRGCYEIDVIGISGIKPREKEWQLNSKIREKHYYAAKAILQQRYPIDAHHHLMFGNISLLMNATLVKLFGFEKVHLADVMIQAGDIKYGDWKKIYEILKPDRFLTPPR